MLFLNSSELHCNLNDSAPALHNEQGLTLIRGIMCSATEKMWLLIQRYKVNVLNSKSLKGKGDIRLSFLLTFNPSKRIKAMCVRYTECTRNRSARFLSLVLEP